VLLTGAARRLPPAKAVEPERGFEPLTCSLRGRAVSALGRPAKTHVAKERKDASYPLKSYYSTQ
jgi:hypothetical protein